MRQDRDRSSRYASLGFLGYLCTAVIALGLSECGGKSISQQVQITILPSSPIVFNSPLTYTDLSGNPINLTGPWMKFQVIINNTSNQPVTIEALTISIADNNNPSALPTLVTFNPSSDNYTTQTSTLFFGDYGEFDPGGSALPAQGSTASLTGQYNDSPLFELPTAAVAPAVRSTLPYFTPEVYQQFPQPKLNSPIQFKFNRSDGSAPELIRLGVSPILAILPPNSRNPGSSQGSAERDPWLDSRGLQREVWLKPNVSYIPISLG